MIGPGSYRFRPDSLTPFGGWTGNVAKMIRPGSYCFRPDSLTPFGDAKFCDSPPVMWDYLSNEITFNTPILSKDLMREQFFIHKMFLDM